jgi:predicted GNAT family N-acyltransferase
MLRDHSWLLQKSLSRTGAGMITIRAANTTRDLEECFRIRAEVFIVEQGVPADLERDEHDSKALHFIALADGQSVGTARVVLGDRGTSAKIGRMAVYRSNRGLGIGKLLIAAIEGYPDLKRVHTFFLDAQTHALQFYEGLGYEAYGKEFMDAGMPHRCMKKRNRHSVARD